MLPALTLTSGHKSTLTKTLVVDDVQITEWIMPNVLRGRSLLLVGGGG